MGVSTVYDWDVAMKEAQTKRASELAEATGATTEAARTAIAMQDTLIGPPMWFLDGTGRGLNLYVSADHKLTFGFSGFKLAV